MFRSLCYYSSIMHLVALKHTLLELDISVNPRINDDAIPSLCALSGLEYLGCRATMISMDGIRKFVTYFTNEMRNVKLEIPVGCMEYLQGLLPTVEAHSLIFFRIGESLRREPHGTSDCRSYSMHISIQRGSQA